MKLRPANKCNVYWDTDDLATPVAPYSHRCCSASGRACVRALISCMCVECMYCMTQCSLLGHTNTLLGCIALGNRLEKTNGIRTIFLRGTKEQKS